VSIADRSLSSDGTAIGASSNDPNEKDVRAVKRGCPPRRHTLTLFDNGFLAMLLRPRPGQSWIAYQAERLSPQLLPKHRLLRARQFGSCYIVSQATAASAKLERKRPGASRAARRRPLTHSTASLVFVTHNAHTANDIFCDYLGRPYFFTTSF